VPAGHRLTGRQVLDVAGRVERTATERRRHPRAFANVWLKGADRWQVSWYTRSKPPREVAQVIVGDATGTVLEAWTGPQVQWTMARGYPGAFGRAVNAPWLWLGLTALFVVPFVSLRRGQRMLAADLAAIAALGVSLAWFNAARIDLSVPLAYPPLVYLLGRMVWIGLRPRAAGSTGPQARLLIPVRWLVALTVFLIGFRISLNVLDSNVIDVGYSGVIGADRLGDGATLWGTFPADNGHGDTYGPVAYAAYLPFEQILPWDGGWGSLHAAHAGAIAADLACLALLWRIGSRIGGAALGAVLAYAWAACPFTLYVLNTNGNDGLVAALVLAALAAATSPAASGVLVGLAGWAKFAPLALAPLLATAGENGEDGPPVRARRFAAGLALVSVLAGALVLASGGAGTFLDRTLGFQATRDSPFSVWGQWDGLGAVQVVVQAAAVLLAVAVAFVPRRRDLAGLAALSAAVLIAAQLGISHWFYLYVVWFLGPVLVALLGRHGWSTWSMASARSASEQRTATAMSQGSSSDVSKRTDIWVASERMACSLRTPMTPPRGPVIPTSVM
jgi:hypothetical protein